MPVAPLVAYLREQRAAKKRGGKGGGGNEVNTKALLRLLRGGTKVCGSVFVFDV